MAVTYAQFILDYPEYSALAQTTVQSRLTFWNGFLSGFGDAHDEAVYVRTAFNLSERIFTSPAGPMDQAGGSEDKYQEAWDRFLALNHRRGHISGGGLT